MEEKNLKEHHDIRGTLKFRIVFSEKNVWMVKGARNYMGRPFKVIEKGKVEECLKE